MPGREQVRAGHRIAFAAAGMLAALAGLPAADAQQHPSLLNMTVGKFGFDGASSQPWVFGIEYRMRPVGEWRLRPSFGVMMADNDAAFAYAEVRKDFRPGEDWVVSPSFGVGLFNEKEGLLLGHPVEFRTGIEVAREFSGGQQVGLAIFHVSNGGLSGRNPGTEVLSVSFSVPVGD